MAMEDNYSNPAEKIEHDIYSFGIECQRMVRLMNDDVLSSKDIQDIMEHTQNMMTEMVQISSSKVEEVKNGKTVETIR
jgi:hypothetical protein